MSGYEEISLSIPEDVRDLMDERRILREDVQKTIYHAETTGEKFVDPSRARSLAFFRPDRVTYWVEYSRVGEDYRIYTVYSHRMEMKRKGTP
jgi:glutamate synthase (NADPH/NADH) small chain